jgi:c-di-GMP-binding flagellar brake protein YcgR
MFLIYVEGSGKKQRLIVDKRRISGKIADISVGGCSVRTTVPIKVGVKFKVDFKLGDSKMAALGQVLRTNRKGANTIIHIKFLRVTQKSMNQINAFVYEYANE